MDNSMMPDPFGPNDRPDAKPLADNVIRRFREELRMDRPEFAELVDAKVDSLRVWEKGSSKPRTEAAMRIVQVAERNNYPLTLEDIFPVNLTNDAKRRTKKSPGR